MRIIDDNKKPYKMQLFLAKPNKVIISKLKHSSNKRLIINYNETDELSFTLPYEYIKNHVRKPYKPTKQLKEKFLVKMVYGKITKWFVISKYNPVSNDADEMMVQCFSLEHQINRKRVISFQRTSHNCLMVTEEVLKNTGWKVGYINPDFNLKYHSFDVSSDSKLSFLYEIAETFGAVIQFDTIKKTVNYYKPEELSKFKGFTISEKKYLDMIESSVDSAEVVTRLYVTGKDGLGIQSVNPTGQAYIDDFSYFLYPFEMDEKGNVIRSSYFMEDDLAIALVKYNKYVSSRKGEFGNLLSEKSKIQEKLTEQQNKLFLLKLELQIILDQLTVAKEAGRDQTEIKRKRDQKNAEIKTQESVVNNITTQLKGVIVKITRLGEEIALERHFSPTLLEMLYDFIHEAEWSDDNKIDPNDLYESGMDHLSEINSPPIDITLDIVNFFNVVAEQRNWDKLNKGDIVRIKHDKLNINVKARVTSIQLEEESDKINITISNLKEVNDIKNKLKRAFYTIDRVNTDYNKRKINWNTTTQNFNLRNDRITEIPANPTVSSSSLAHRTNDDGSANLILKWDYPDWNETKENKHNIDGFLIYLHDDVTNEPYQFTSKMSAETIVNVTPDKRSYTFPAVPANLFYTVGIQAYRRVDEDINSDGILLSEIVKFAGKSNDEIIGGIVSLSTSNQSNDLTPPYRPSPYVDFRGRIHGREFFFGDLPPTVAPSPGDIWFDEGKWHFYDENDKWMSDEEIEEMKRKFEEFEKEMEQFEKELRKELDENQKIVDDAMREVEDEMERIESEVVPAVEKAIEDTFIPKQDTPPDEIPPSGLWIDTSQDPPRHMRWNGTEWVVLAPTEDEIKNIMDVMGREAVAEGKRYTKLDIMKTRKVLNDKIDNEIVQVQDNIEALEETAGALLGRVGEAEEHIGNLRDDIGEWGDLSGVVDSHTSWIEQTEEEIIRAFGSITNIDGTISALETQVGQNSEAIGLSATKLEVEHLDGEIQTISESVATLTVAYDNITSEVSRIEEDLDGKISSNSTLIEQTADAINTRIDNFEITYGDDKEGILESISQNRTDIEATAEGLSLRVTKEELTGAIDGMQIGGRNLLTHIFENWEKGIYSSSSGEKTSGDKRIRVKNPIMIEAEANYLIHSEDTDYEVIYVFYDSDMNYLSGETWSKFPISVLSPENAKYLTISVRKVPEVVFESIDFKIMVEKGTKQTQWVTPLEDTEHQILSLTSSVETIAGQISMMVEREELEHYVDYTTYRNEIGTFTVGTGTIAGRVEKTETDFNNFRTGDYNDFKQDYGEFKLDANQFMTRVGTLSDDGDTLVERVSAVTQTANGIVSTVSSIETSLEDKVGKADAVSTVVVEYYLSSSPTSPTGGSWNVIPPEWVSGKYFWSRTKTTYSDGEVTYTEPVNISGAKGDPGEDGKGITNSVVTYKYHTNGNTAPTGTWSDKVPSPIKGQYLWTRTVTTYTDGSNVTTYSVAYTATDGQKGDDGKGISSTTTTYQISTSGTTIPTGTWNSSPPTPIKGRYLWTRVVISYTDGTDSTSYSTSYYATDGQKGDTGQGVDSVTTQYYSSTSKTTQTGGSWVNTQPEWAKGRYLWTRTKIVYKNPAATEYTTPIIDNSWESMTIVETKIEQLPDQINLVVSEGISNLEIGDTNLILNSGVTQSSSEYQVAEYFISEDFVEGQEYTVVLKGSKSASQEFGIWQNAASSSRGSLIYQGEHIWSLTFTSVATNSGDERRIRIYQPPSAEASSATIEWIKLVKGNKASLSWSAAPEELVDKSTVLSSINLSTEGIGINAEKIDFSGLAAFTPMSKNFHNETTIASGSAGKWFRIASNSGSRAHGRFIITDTTSSQHGTAVFEAGINYGKNPYINLTSYGLYGSRSFTKARIIYNSTYDNVYVDLYINNNTRDQSLAYWLTDNIQVNGWVGVNWTSASVPSGYTSFERIINEENVVQGTLDKWKYGNTTMINGGEIYTNTITTDQLNVNQIFGNSAVISKIQADSIATATLNATKITTGTLDASRISVTNLSASVITTGTLNAAQVTVSNINASNIKSGTLDVDRIGATSIKAVKLDVDEIFANSAVVSKIKSDIISVTELDAKKISTGTLNADRIGAGTITADHIAVGAIKIGNFESSVQADINAGASALANAKKYVDDTTGNLVKNPAVEGNSTGWSGGSVTSVMDTFQGVSTRVLRNSASTNSTTYSEWYSVDPSKAYEVSMWVRKSAARGRRYIGLHGGTSDTNNVAFLRASDSGSVVAESTNAYFATSGTNTGWVKVVGYLMPSGTKHADMAKIGENVEYNLIMRPDLKRVRIRWLNYENGGTTTYMYVAMPKFVEVDPNAVIRGTKATETTALWQHPNSTLIDGGNIYTNSITANQINVDNLFANSAVINILKSDIITTTDLDATRIKSGTLSADRIGAGTITAEHIRVGTGGITGNANLAAGRQTTGTTVSTVATDGNKKIGSDYMTFGAGSSSNTGTESSYIQIDLGAVYRVEQSKIYFYSGDNRYYWYKIRYSINGSTWHYAVGNANSNGWKKSIPKNVSGATVHNPTIDNFAVPINARYLRIYGNGNSTNTGNHLYEWELYSFVQTEIFGDQIVTGTLSASQITTGTLDADRVDVKGTISGITIEGGSITSNTTIDVNTNLSVGNRIRIGKPGSARKFLEFGDANASIESDLADSVSNIYMSSLKTRVTGLMDLTLYGQTGKIFLETEFGYGQFGARNSSFFHMSTNRPQFYMYQPLTIDGRLTSKGATINRSVSGVSTLSTSGRITSGGGISVGGTITGATSISASGTISTGGATIDGASNIARWKQSDANYIMQAADGQVTFYAGGAWRQAFYPNGNIGTNGTISANVVSAGGATIETNSSYTYFYPNGTKSYAIRMTNSSGYVAFMDGSTIKHGFNMSGTKLGGTIEIDNEVLGMSPIDSPRVLISDMLLNINLTANVPKKLKLNKKYVKAISEYGVFPSQPVNIVKEKDGFIVTSTENVMVDFMIYGTRVGQEGVYWPKPEEELGSN